MINGAYLETSKSEKQRIQNIKNLLAKNSVDTSNDKEKQLLNLKIKKIILQVIKTQLKTVRQIHKIIIKRRLKQIKEKYLVKIIN